MLKHICLAVTLLSLATPSSAQEFKPVKLAPPQLAAGTSLMQALKDRQSSRSFSKKPLPHEVLSQLLWAADGVNRPESGKRTAPSAMNRQEIDIYVAAANGLFLYKPREHSLLPILKQDIRALTGRQSYAADAALNLIYVADFSRVPGNTGMDEKMVFAAVQAGCICQNVYLYCAQEHLATVARASIDKEALATVMRLKDHQNIILAQSVGYPSQ
jgi:SagB-type dehydrogenase family enzyme